MSTVAKNDVGAFDLKTDRDEVEVTLFWGKSLDKNALAQKHLPIGRAIRVGEVDGADFSIPLSALGTDVHEIVSSQGGQVLVTPPATAFVFVDRLPRQATPFVLEPGHSCEVEIGAFSLRVSVGAAEKKIPLALASRLEESGLGMVGFSAVAHAAFIAAFAFFMPSLGQADQEGIDRNQILSMKTYLDAAAEREKDAPPPDQSQAADSQSASSNGGQRAEKEEGKMGGDKPVVTPGHWAAQGQNRPEDVTLAREQALNEAREFGMVGLLNAANASDPKAPVVPWGTVLAGADKASYLGNIWSGDMGDALGTGGLGLSGTGEGGGGKGQGIGVNPDGGIGHYGPNCAAGDTECLNGWGHGHGTMQRQHDAGKGPTLRQPKTLETNGRLDPEVIRRIVRQNSGRMVGCYQDGLRNNPTLQGRVSVSFVIDREGAVMSANDSSGSDLADSNVRSCVVKSFYNISFPKPQGGIVTVVYPLVFSPSE